MENIIKLISQTISEADEETSQWVQEEPYDPQDPYYQKGAEIQAKAKEAYGEGWTEREHKTNALQYEDAKKQIWQLFDDELSLLEHYARNGVESLKRDTFTTSDLPNFKRLAHLCRRTFKIGVIDDSLWVDLRYPILLDEATRQSPRRMVMIGQGRLEQYANSKSGVSLGAHLLSLMNLSASQLVNKIENSPNIINQLLNHFDKLSPQYQDSEAVVNAIRSHSLSPSELARNLAEQYIKSGLISLSRPEKISTIQLYAAGEDINVESISTHYAGGGRGNIINVNQIIKANSPSTTVQLPEARKELISIDFNYTLPNSKPAGIQIYGLISGSDEDANAYLQRLLKTTKLRRYRQGPGKDKLLQPGKAAGNNLARRVTSTGVSIKSGSFMTPLEPELAENEANEFMKRILQLKLDVIQVTTDGSGLRTWIKHKFDRRFPNFDSYIKDKRLLKNRQARWALQAGQVKDYTKKDGLTLNDIKVNLKAWRVLIAKSINEIELPKTAEMIKSRPSGSLEDFSIEPDIFNFEVSGEYGKLEYCQKLDDIIDINNTRLYKVNSSFRVLGLIGNGPNDGRKATTYRPANDDFRDIGRMVESYYDQYTNQFLSALDEMEEEMRVGGAKIGTRELPELRLTKFVVNIDEAGNISQDWDEPSLLEPEEPPGPARHASKVRIWDSIVESGDKNDPIVLRYEVAGDTFYVGTTLDEVYSRGLIGSGKARTIEELNSRLHNATLLPVEGNETKIVESAHYIKETTNRYAYIINLDVYKLLQEIRKEAGLNIKNVDSIDDIERALDIVERVLSLNLNIDILTQSEPRLKKWKTIAWGCIKKIVEVYVNNYGKEKSGWRPGFLIEGDFILKQNKGGRKTTLITSGVSCGAYYWDRRTVEYKLGAGAHEFTERENIVASHPIFYQSWLPSADELTQTSKELKEKLSEPGEKREKLEKRIADIEQAIEELSSISSSDISIEIESLDDARIYQWPEYTDPQQQLVIKYSNQNCICGHSPDEHIAETDEMPGDTAKMKPCEAQVEEEKCDCKDLRLGKKEYHKDVLTVKDLYEKDIEGRFPGYEIEKVNDIADEDHYHVLRKIQAYTDPTYDNDSNGLECALCSKYEERQIFHLRPERLGNVQYPKEDEVDHATAATAKEQGIDLGQLVRLTYKLYEGDSNNSQSITVILRRHEITERKFLDEIEPMPIIRPAADSTKYQQLFNAMANFNRLKSIGGEELNHAVNILKRADAEIKKINNSVFILIPKHLETNGEEVPAKLRIISAVADEHGYSELDALLSHQQKLLADFRAGTLPESKHWMLGIKVPRNIDDSYDTNGMNITRQNEYIDPAIPGGPADDLGTKHYNQGMQENIYDDLINAISTGKTSNQILQDPLSGGLAPWITHERYEDVLYLIMPPVNQQFFDEFGHDKRGKQIPGAPGCYHCDRPVGHLLIESRTDGYWVDIPYVRSNDQGDGALRTFKLPLSVALSQLKDLWVSHRWTEKELDFPQIGIVDVPVKENIDGFKTYQTTKLTPAELSQSGGEPGPTPVSKVIGLIKERERQTREPSRSKCQNLIWDKKTESKKQCGNVAYISETPKVLISSKTRGGRTWKVLPPAIAAAYRKIEGIQDRNEPAYLEAYDDVNEAKLRERLEPEGVKRFCQACFVSRFDLFPDYIIQQMNADLEDVLVLARKVWVKGNEITDNSEQKAWKREINERLENFAIKWFSDQYSFWKTWDDYINNELKLEAVKRKGATLPNYLTKNLLRARYRVMQQLEQIVKNNYLDDIFFTGPGGKPNYIRAVEQIQGTISGWGIWNNNFKLKGYERSDIQRGDTGLLHTVSLWKTMTSAEKNKNPYDAEEDPVPFMVKRYRQPRRTQGHRPPQGQGPQESTFEEKHRSLISEENRKYAEKLSIIRLISKFTSDSLYW